MANTITNTIRHDSSKYIIMANSIGNSIRHDYIF